MRYFLLFLLVFSCFGNDFSNKKILKIKPNEDEFKIINLNQSVKFQDINNQKAVFNNQSPNKKTIKTIKENDKDFAILASYDYKTFGFVTRNLKISQEIFAKDIIKNSIFNLLSNKKYHFLNSQANGLYQNQKVLNFLDSNKNYKIINIAKFMRYEKDKNKIYSKNTDYLIFIALDDFYVSNNIANAYIKYKILDIKTKKVKIFKSLHIKFTLKAKNDKENYVLCTNEIAKALSSNIISNLKKI